ncbi:unnamed protein product, partial [Phaeothamnion confervicola]
MSISFLSKKSWHTGTLRNQEKVWIAERSADDEAKRIRELQRQVEDERSDNKLRQLVLASGRAVDDGTAARVDWMYEGPAAAAAEADQRNADAYLLGKEFRPANAGPSEVKTLTEGGEPGCMFLAARPANSANEAFRRLHEDPLLVMRRAERDATAAVVANPVRMQRIQVELERELAEKRARKAAEKEVKRQRKEARREAKRARKGKKREKREKEKDGGDSDGGGHHHRRRHRDERSDGGGRSGGSRSGGKGGSRTDESSSERGGARGDGDAGKHRKRKRSRERGGAGSGDDNDGTHARHAKKSGSGGGLSGGDRDSREEAAPARGGDGSPFRRNEHHRRDRQHRGRSRSRSRFLQSTSSLSSRVSSAAGRRHRRRDGDKCGDAGSGDKDVGRDNGSNIEDARIGRQEEANGSSNGGGGSGGGGTRKYGLVGKSINGDDGGNGGGGGGGGSYGSSTGQL